MFHHHHHHHRPEVVIVEGGRHHHHPAEVVVVSPGHHHHHHHPTEVIVESPGYGAPMAGFVAGAAVGAAMASPGYGYGGAPGYVAAAPPAYLPGPGAVVLIPTAPHVVPVPPHSLVNTGRPFLLHSFLGTSAGVHGFHEGAPIILHSTDIFNPHLKWTLTSHEPGVFRLHTHEHHHFVLHQHGGLLHNGGQVTLLDTRTHGFPHHSHVTLEPHMDGWVIRFRHSGKALTASAAAIGSPLYQWDIVVAESNRWRFLAL